MLRTHGVLVMARNDLVASRPLPALTTPPQTTDLYFSGPSCDWGATPNYLPVPDSDRATTLPVRSAIPRTVVHYSGWAVDPATNRPASHDPDCRRRSGRGHGDAHDRPPGRGKGPAPGCARHAGRGPGWRAFEPHLDERLPVRRLRSIPRSTRRPISSARTGWPIRSAGRRPDPLRRCVCRTGARSRSRRRRAATSRSTTSTRCRGAPAAQRHDPT